MKPAMLTAFVLLVGSHSALSQQPHFHFAGPMTAHMLTGASPGRITGGLPFSLVLTDKGGTISPDRFELKGEQWNNNATLSFADLKYEAGILKSTVSISNGSGSVIEGVRLDITGATEEYMAVDADGKPIKKTRGQAATIASPMLFGDIPNGQVSDPWAIAVSGITFKPETLRVSVHGRISGLYFLGGFNVGRIKGVAAIDTDSQGHLYLADVVGKAIVRANADGSNPTSAATLPDQCTGVAVDPKSGDIYGTCMNNPAILRFSADGRAVGKIEPKDGLTGWVHNIRAKADGTLYSDMSGSVVQIVNGKAGSVVSQVAGHRLSARLFDVDRAGNLWICASNALYRTDLAGKAGKQIATGPDWHLGAITTPNGCRIDKDGQVYVTEADNGKEVGRISVFDADGKIIRVFGRGDKAPKPNGIHAGQISRAKDIAFGSDGRVLILHDGGPGTPTQLILAFQPF